MSVFCMAEAESGPKHTGMGAGAFGGGVSRVDTFTAGRYSGSGGGVYKSCVNPERTGGLGANSAAQAPGMIRAVLTHAKLLCRHRLCLCCRVIVLLGVAVKCLLVCPFFLAFVPARVCCGAGHTNSLPAGCSVLSG